MSEWTHRWWPAFAMICCAMTVGCYPSMTEDAPSTAEPSSPAANRQSVTRTPPPAASPAETTHADFYTVSSYDKSRDPAADLAETITRAGAEDKRVILQVGGDWCGWCARLSKYMSSNDKVRSHLQQNFLVMKVTYPGDHADAFLAAYPPRDGYPHLYVLDRNGELLHSQSTSELEKGAGYDEEKVMAFLTEWAPPAPVAGSGGEAERSP